MAVSAQMIKKAGLQQHASLPQEKKKIQVALHKRKVHFFLWSL